MIFTVDAATPEAGAGAGAGTEALCSLFGKPAILVVVLT
jgi:hypothetical protein